MYLYRNIEALSRNAVQKQYNENLSLDRPLGLHEVEASRISRQHMNVVRLSALSTGRLYPQERSMVFISESESTPRP